MGAAEGDLGLNAVQETENTDRLGALLRALGPDRLHRYATAVDEANATSSGWRNLTTRGRRQQMPADLMVPELRNELLQAMQARGLL